MYAVFFTGGKQYKASLGDILYIEKIEANDGDVITFDEVKLISDEKGLTVGTPNIEGATVRATLLKNDKAKKIIVATYKPKKGSKRKLGHRQPYSKVQIDSIEA